MSFFEFCQWIETTSLSIAIREGALYYPILGAFHMLGIAWFGGMLLMGDLRVLGIGLRQEPASELLSQFRRWKWVGFVILFVSGGLLWWCEPVVCYKSLSFRAKVVLLLLVGLNSLVLKKRFEASVVAGDRASGSLTSAVAGPVQSRGARLAAGLSLLLWAGLILTGRGIAFL